MATNATSTRPIRKIGAGFPRDEFYGPDRCQKDLLEGANLALSDNAKQGEVHVSTIKTLSAGIYGIFERQVVS